MVRLDVKNKLKWVRIHKWRSLLLLVVALVAGYFVYDKIALELNKRAFQNARTAINAVYADIVAKARQPDNSKSTNECSRSHVAIGNGPLSCYIDMEFIYAVADKTEADNLRNKITTVVYERSDIFKRVQPPSSSIDITPSGSTEENNFIEYYSAGGLLCAIKYVFDNPKETFLKLENTEGQKTFFVGISCSSDARATFYPVVN